MPQLWSEVTTRLCEGGVSARDDGDLEPGLVAPGGRGPGFLDLLELRYLDEEFRQRSRVVRYCLPVRSRIAGTPRSHPTGTPCAAESSARTPSKSKATRSSTSSESSLITLSSTRPAGVSSHDGFLHVVRVRREKHARVEVRNVPKGRAAAEKRRAPRGHPRAPAGTLVVCPRNIFTLASCGQQVAKTPDFRGDCGRQRCRSAKVELQTCSSDTPLDTRPRLAPGTPGPLPPDRTGRWKRLRRRAFARSRMPSIMPARFRTRRRRSRVAPAVRPRKCGRAARSAITSSSAGRTSEAPVSASSARRRSRNRLTDFERERTEHARPVLPELGATVAADREAIAVVFPELDQPLAELRERFEHVLLLVPGIDEAAHALVLSARRCTSSSRSAGTSYRRRGHPPC